MLAKRGAIGHAVSSGEYDPDRPAVICVRRRRRNRPGDPSVEEDAEPPYWPDGDDGRRWWRRPRHVGDVDGDGDGNDDGVGTERISYGSLFLAARGAARALAEELRDGGAGRRPPRRRRRPAVGVSIPEGPYLPLAVLTVHALAAEASGSKLDATGAPALVPVDIDEGAERLGRVLVDADPDLVLCCGGRDADRIRGALAAGAEGGGGGDDGAAAEAPLKWGGRVVDFADLVERALLRADGWPEAAGPTRPSPSARPAAEDGNPGVGVDDRRVVSHVVYTSGTTGRPKGCVSSLASLLRYLPAKNDAHGISDGSVVFLASSLSFDPCLGDILATLYANATLAIAPREAVLGDLAGTLKMAGATHILCTPTLWGTMSGARPANLPALRAVALGGEPIPRGIVSAWARSRKEEAAEDGGAGAYAAPRLLATYGVTEACVYQTCGEVFADDGAAGIPDAPTADVHGGRARGGQDVGLPLRGTRVRICRERPPQESEATKGNPPGPHALEDVGVAGEVGEVVLSGAQLDSLSGYLNLPGLTAEKFVAAADDEVTGAGNVHHYRTGDRGYLHPVTGHLHILGRIDGEEGMVKLNGVRVELGEIEAAIQDDASAHERPRLVMNCIVTARQVEAGNGPDSTYMGGRKRLVAYCVLSRRCLEDLGLAGSPSFNAGGDDGTAESAKPGVTVPPAHPLLVLLRARCEPRVRRGTVPSAFVIIPHAPLTATGKCDRGSLPPPESCPYLSAAGKGTDAGGGGGGGDPEPLRSRGRSGPAVAAEVVDVLNLRHLDPSRLDSVITARAGFAALGGDSLSATRVVRGLYARHHGIRNARTLGGKYGTLEGPFGVEHLLGASALGKYVDWLDSHGICQGCVNEGDDEEKKVADSDAAANNAHDGAENVDSLPTYSSSQEDSTKNHFPESGESPPSEDNSLYGALLQSAALGLTTIAISLLDLGANPNFGDHGRRLGKGRGGTKGQGRRARKDAFKSNPLHLACIRGDVDLVEALLRRGCKANSPDASGSFPVHLACSGGSVPSREGAEQGGAGAIDPKAPVTAADDAEKMRRSEEDARRMRCAELLFNLGKVPLSMKDGNKQTVLHCAARSGHTALLTYLMERWDRDIEDKPDPNGLGKFDQQDRWFRTPVHWAVLNGHADTLRVLLWGGRCSPKPPRPRESVGRRRSSVAIESPLEICARLYGTEEGLGREISELLLRAMARQCEEDRVELGGESVEIIDKESRGDESPIMSNIDCWERILW